MKEAKEKNWVIKPQGDPASVATLAGELGIDPVLSELLLQRGVTNFEEARSFFRPNLLDLHDPFLMKDMDKAIDRISSAIETKEKILVYGDYDVDGTTAVSLVVSFLRKLTTNIGYYIPDRYDEGYGVSYKGIDKAAAQGYTLIITLDCGIKAIDKTEYARSKGIDMIICDHHLPEDTIPAAVAVLDPKREDCNYPFDDLSGCGVGFKLVQAYCQRHNIPFETIYPLLDLLVVSIAADLVSVTGENRILAYYGLKQINDRPHKGLGAMIRLVGLEIGKITIDDIVFKIGPRINAAGRMESGSLAVELLLAKDDATATECANQINNFNNERKNIDRDITLQAREMVQQGKCVVNDNIIVVYDPSWHKGVVGIVASRLVEQYYKPAIVFTMTNGFVTGSARSIQGYDLYSAIESCADILENYGGHLYAAGLTLREENLKTFSSRVNSLVSATLTEEITTPVIDIDAALSFDKITPKFFRILRQFQPFGPGNQAPVFISEEVYDNGNGRRVGAEAGHLKLDLIQEHQPYHIVPAIGFNQAMLFDYIKAGNPVDICYSIVENYYRGTTTLQLRLKDIRKHQDNMLGL